MRKHGLVPLKLYYNDERRDNFPTASEQGRRYAETAGWFQPKPSNSKIEKQLRDLVTQVQ